MVSNLRSWSRVHTWTSLACTLFLLLLCITGLPLVFHEEIDAWAAPAVPASSQPEGTADAPLTDIVASAQSRYPKEYIQAMSWKQGGPHTVMVYMAKEPRSALSGYHALSIDAHTAAVLDEPRPRARFTQWLLTLHRELFAGLPGMLLLGIMGLCFVVSIVSGVLIYGPFTQKAGFGEIRRNRSKRAKWLDLHNLLGIVLLAWTLVVGVTGVVNTLADPLFAYWRTGRLAEMLAPWHGKPLLVPSVSLDAAVAAAQRALPGTSPESVAFPYSAYGSPHHYMIWMQGNTPITSRLLTPVLVDVEQGGVTDAQDLPWYLRALELSRPLHFGDYGGLPLKLLWAAFDLVTIGVLLTGLYLWGERHKRPRGEGAAA
ncbi:PepSY-associated TM helix domain-containing protein [Luteibacter sp. Lutesp34]|uniref:PepSY-associated TM helix domain-containing protein n=1 Tax=Luteibacter sp. Lutesp34 TaxID=3243030 RepID=UPI0039B3A7E0